MKKGNGSEMNIINLCIVSIDLHYTLIQELQRSASVQNTTRPNSAITKAYYPVPVSTMIPSVAAVPIAMETKTQAVQTNGTLQETKMFRDYAEKEYSLSQALTKVF